MISIEELKRISKKGTCGALPCSHCPINEYQKKHHPEITDHSQCVTLIPEYLASLEKTTLGENDIVMFGQNQYGIYCKLRNGYTIRLSDSHRSWGAAPAQKMPLIKSRKELRRKILGL